MSLETLRWPRSRIIFRHLARVYACQGLCVYHCFRERERERGERKENGVYGGSRRRAVAISGALCIYNCIFCPAAADSGSIRRKQVHRTRGDSVGAGHFTRPLSHYARFYRRKKERKKRRRTERKLGMEKKGMEKKERNVESESCSIIS